MCILINYCGLDIINVTSYKKELNITLWLGSVNIWEIDVFTTYLLSNVVILILLFLLSKISICYPILDSVNIRIRLCNKVE